MRVRGSLEGWAAGFGGEAAVRETIAAALEDAGIPRSALAVVAGDVAETSGATRAVAARPGALGAAGPLALLAALDAAPPGAPVLVVAACPTGHVAALVARRAEGA